MSTTMNIARTEAKLFARDPIALFFGFIFPGLLLLLLGLFFPGFDEPSADLGGDRYIDVYAPLVLALGLATLGLVTLPPILGTYRQFGILRRLRTTPVHPARLLWAQLAVHVGVAVAALPVGSAVGVSIDVVPVGTPVGVEVGGTAVFGTSVGGTIVAVGGTAVSVGTDVG